jgi:hypothetical protein
LFAGAGAREAFCTNNFLMLRWWLTVECRNIVPLEIELAAVIHLRDGGRASVVSMPLAKADNTRKFPWFKD